ncbi:MAG: hypothetical protein HKN86_02110 [Acidimicrobiia bacterium]|nr:hypothetical protein [Acidimicrobiia bacterium]
MTIEQTWEYGKERGLECYSSIISDVDFFEENNSVLFAPGFNVFNGSFNRGGRIVELDYTSKDVIFEAIIIDLGLTFHRVERIDFY